VRFPNAAPTTNYTQTPLTIVLTSHNCNRIGNNNNRSSLFNSNDLVNDRLLHCKLQLPIYVDQRAIQETKLYVKTEDQFHAVSKFLNVNGKKYHTYQLKSSKRLQVVLKGIDPDVTTNEVANAFTKMSLTLSQLLL